MSFNETLANRVRELIATREKRVEEKRMFGGLCFMVNDKMCVGVKIDSLMLRIDPELTDEVLEKEGCQPMIMKGKLMQGFVYVDADVLSTKKKLEYWVGLALAYNKIAKSSKKKK